MELVILGTVIYLASEKIFNISKVPKPLFKKHQVDEYTDDNEYGVGLYPEYELPGQIPRHYGDEGIRQYPIREFQPVFDDNSYLYGSEPAYKDPGYNENMSVINSTLKQ